MPLITLGSIEDFEIYNPLDYNLLVCTLSLNCQNSSREAKLCSLGQKKKALIDYLARHPKAGCLIPETGGIRKLRWARPGMGKSGGARVIYYYHNENMPLYLLTIFSKGEKANLSNQTGTQYPG
jgi:hypothetical protein